MEARMNVDEALTTTRAVRRRLDLSRPVARELVEDCLRLAQQAPRASNVERRAFVVVTDAEKRLALAKLWRQGMERYLRAVGAAASSSPSLARMREGVEHLGERLQDVPVHVIPCLLDRVDKRPFASQAGLWGTILPATWSFMLAARARGLGTCWTTFHLAYEREAAETLAIPYHQVTQVALIPVAHTIGDKFSPAAREPLDRIVHWDGW
jgi:nitroreductase